MKNILLIGDSILVGSNQTSGYGTIVRDMLKDKANVYIPLDNARYTMYTLRNLAGWIDAMPREKMDIVQWNNLEWDIGEFYQDGPLTPLPFYVDTLRRIYQRIRLFFPNAEIIYATGTKVIDEKSPVDTLHHKNYDGRFSHGNKEWAEQVSTPEHDADRMTFRTDWVVDSHPAVLDGFVTMFRKEQEAQKELEQEQPFVKQFYVVENLQAVPLKIERFGNLDDAMSQYQALPNHCMKALGVEKNPDPLPGSLDVLQCRNGIDTIVKDHKTVPGWDNPYIQNHVVQPLQGALAVQDVELAYELPDAYFHIQTCDDGFDYTLYNKDFTERDGGVLETDGDKSVQEAMTELLAEFGCDAAEGKVMDAAELREQADAVAEQQAEVLKEKLAAERPAPEETLSFYVAECLEFTFAGEFHDHLTMEEALEAYDKIPSERMNADKCIGFCIEEDGGFVGMYELVVNDKVQRENINFINYFRDDKLVQQAISDMEKLMAERQQSKEQERGSTKKSVLDALRSLKAKKQEQPAREQDKPKKAKKKGMEL